METTTTGVVSILDNLMYQLRVEMKNASVSGTNDFVCDLGRVHLELARLRNTARGNL